MKDGFVTITDFLDENKIDNIEQEELEAQFEYWQALIFMLRRHIRWMNLKSILMV